MLNEEREGRRGRRGEHAGEREWYGGGAVLLHSRIRCEITIPSERGVVELTRERERRGSPNLAPPSPLAISCCLNKTDTDSHTRSNELARSPESSRPFPPPSLPDPFPHPPLLNHTCTDPGPTSSTSSNPATLPSRSHRDDRGRGR